MIMFKQLLDRVAARLVPTSPDRSWVHCYIAFAVILGLVFMLYGVNQRSIHTVGGAELAFLGQLRWAIVIAAALLLMAEITIIFLTAQLAARSNMRALRDQTACLLESKAQLERVNAQLLHLANHDPATGLPNRSSLIAFMAKNIALGIAAEQTFLFIGLDGFKAINDSAGHDVGDALLVTIGQALQSCIDDDQIVARIGGDEFAVMTDEPPTQMLRRITAVLADPFEVQGRRLKIGASIGYLVLDHSQSEPMAILSDASIALQFAKTSGGRRAQHFTPQLRENAGQLQRLQMELPDAIRNGELEPWFQPQVRLTDGVLHGAEVLARWRHPTRGLLTPDKFLPAAERSGMMIEMDHAIWQSAMAHAIGWQRSDIWRPVISLNAAPDTISDPHMIERFLLALRRSGLAGDQVIVEVLETTLIDGSDDMAAINIDTLAECGIALELDDFGTGYASLCRLTQLPLSGIKLDKSLVSPLPDPGADSVVRAVLALAAELGLHVVAEGIEFSSQARHLRERGCAFGQGYGFARPMPPKEFRSWLRLHATNPVRIADDHVVLVKQA